MDFRYFNTDTQQWEPTVVDPDEFAVVKNQTSDLLHRYPKHANIITDWNSISESGLYAGYGAINGPAYGQWLIGEFISHIDGWGILRVRALYGVIVEYIRYRTDTGWQDWQPVIINLDQMATKSYSEGVFTPTIINSGSTIFTAQTGTYSKVGRRVYIDLELRTTTVDPGFIASATPIAIGALPYIFDGHASSLSIGFSNYGYSKSISAMVVNTNPGVVIKLYDGGNVLLSSGLVNNSEIHISGSYLTS